MSKRIILLTIVSGLIIVAIAVGVGLYTYTNIQTDKSYENVQKELNRYITMNDWYAYEFHNREESILSFYSNEDRSVIGLAEIDVTTGNSGSVTKQVTPDQPFDFVVLEDGETEYIGVRLNDRPEEVVYLRLNGDNVSKDFLVNDPENEGYAMTYVIETTKRTDDVWSLETLDAKKQVIHSSELTE
ncbi:MULTISPECIES: hypothetical protein [unclassified Exiguobacterium]|uniref:hypothetical protein n=1 Tax=unclassified Exiguobacterium TaxID=2644629 RepID=UPI001BEADF79|nr:MULTISPECIES: hypothetical protein [unclassified Exiguobacterium]